MHSLEVILVMNDRAVARCDGTAPELGWEVSHDGAGQVTIVGNGHHIVVDCSNPLLDDGLVAFHRDYRNIMPSWVRSRVEGLASEYRRLVIVSGRWEACRREAENCLVQRRNSSQTAANRHGAGADPGQILEDRLEVTSHDE